MGAVVNPIGWRLGFIKYWNFYFWVTDLHFGFLSLKFFNIIKIFEFYFLKFEEAYYNKKFFFELNFDTLRVLQNSSNLIFLIFFKITTIFNSFKIINQNIFSNNEELATKKELFNFFCKQNFSFFFYKKFIKNNYFIGLIKKKKKLFYKRLKLKKLKFFNKNVGPFSYQNFFFKKMVGLQKLKIFKFLAWFYFDFKKRLKIKKKDKLKQRNQLPKKILIKPKTYDKKTLKLKNFRFLNNLNKKSKIIFNTKKNIFFLNLISFTNLFKQLNIFFFFGPILYYLKTLLLKKLVSLAPNITLEPKIFFNSDSTHNLSAMFFVKWFLGKLSLKRVRFRQNLLKLLKALNNLCFWDLIRGFQLQIVGRISKKDRALYIWKRTLNVSLSSRAAKINYYENLFITKFSACSLKLWIQET